MVMSAHVLLADRLGLDWSLKPRALVVQERIAFAPARKMFSEGIPPRALIAVTTEPALLAGLGSNSNGAAFTRFVADPVAVGFTIIVTVAVAFLARFVRVHVTVATPSKLQEAPCVLVAETKLTDGGSASVTVKDVTGQGPLFVRLML